VNHKHKLNPQIHKSDTSNQEDYMLHSQELIASNTGRKYNIFKSGTTYNKHYTGITKDDKRIHEKIGVMFNSLATLVTRMM